MESDNSNPKFKIVMLGDSGVGKTSIVLQLNLHEFRQLVVPTVGSGTYTQTIPTKYGSPSVTIWDTAGEERYRSFTNLYSQGASAALIVFDLTDIETFNSLDNWVKIFLEASLPNPLIMILGNKADLEPDRIVSHDKAIEYARSKGYQYLEVSAKTGENVEYAFIGIATQLMEREQVNSSQVNLDDEQIEKNSSCC